MARTKIAIAALGLAGMACATTGIPAPAVAPLPSPTVTAAGPVRTSRPSRVDQGRLDEFVRSRGGIKACYAEELARDAGARGRLLVRFTITAAGEVVEIAVLKSELSPRLANCVTASMVNWQLPFRPAAPVRVEYPMLFAPEG
jgi:TonB family protein